MDAIPQWAWLLVPILISVLVLYWQRRGVVEQASPSIPSLDSHGGEWLKSADGWCKITFTITNLESVRWHVTGARAMTPLGAKILAEIPLSAPNDWTPTEVDAERLNTLPATNSCTLNVILAPAGNHSGTMINGANSSEVKWVYLFVPPRSEASSISIVLNLRSSAFEDRIFNRTLALNISDITMSPTYG